MSRALSLERVEIFLIAYACLLVFTVIALSALMVSEIDIYVAAFVIEYFVVIFATSPHYPVETRRERIIGIMLLAVFSEILIQHVIQLLK